MHAGALAAFRSVPTRFFRVPSLNRAESELCNSIASTASY
jgi:hypothetical protein